MMRVKATCLVASLLLAVLAVTPAPAWSASVDLSWLTAMVEEPGVSPGNMTPIDLAAHKPRITLKATCTALCGSGSPVSCSYSSTCVAVDQNCPSQAGYVQCGSNAPIYCSPACSSVCTDGQLLFIDTGNCCDPGTEEDKYVCSGGEWVYQTTVCRPHLCGPPIR
jgi:hypothetical protein